MSAQGGRGSESLCDYHSKFTALSNLLSRGIFSTAGSFGSEAFP